MDNNYLVHHGILGQKWGIRRYQNYDGSYTQAGLQRYNKSKDAYDSAKSSYKQTERGTIERTRAKTKLKAARKQMNKDYKHLKQDKLADQGKELYREGHTITGGNFGLTYKVGAVAMGTVLTKALAQNSSLASKVLVTKLGNFNVADLAAVGVGLAGSAAITGMRINQYNKDKKLRAYYGHTSRY